MARRRSRPAWLTITAVAVIVMLTVSCSAATPGSDDPGGEAGTLIRADQGGTVTSDDGGATLTVHAGAIAEDTRIELVAVDPADLTDDVRDTQPLGTVYEVRPDGLQFSHPAELEIRHSADAFAAAQEGDDIVLPLGRSRTADGGIEDVLETVTTVDLHEGTASTTLQLEHLSWQWSSLNHLYALTFGVRFPDSGEVGAGLQAPALIKNYTSNIMFASGRSEGHGALEEEIKDEFQGQAVEIASEVPVSFRYHCASEGIGSAWARVLYGTSSTSPGGLGLIVHDEVECRAAGADLPDEIVITDPEDDLVNANGAPTTGPLFLDITEFEVAMDAAAYPGELGQVIRLVLADDIPTKMAGQRYIYYALLFGAGDGSGAPANWGPWEGAMVEVAHWPGGRGNEFRVWQGSTYGPLELMPAPTVNVSGNTIEFILPYKALIDAVGAEDELHIWFITEAANGVAARDITEMAVQPVVTCGATCLPRED